jgi:hypothetical protein
MIENNWIVPAAAKLNTESQAAAHLVRTLPTLSKARAKRILNQKLGFMKAVEEINP